MVVRLLPATPLALVPAQPMLCMVHRTVIIIAGFPTLRKGLRKRVPAHKRPAHKTLARSTPARRAKGQVRMAQVGRFAHSDGIWWVAKVWL